MRLIKKITGRDTTVSDDDYINVLKKLIPFSTLNHYDLYIPTDKEVNMLYDMIERWGQNSDKNDNPEK